MEIIVCRHEYMFQPSTAIYTASAPNGTSYTELYSHLGRYHRPSQDAIMASCMKLAESLIWRMWWDNWSPSENELNHPIINFRSLRQQYIARLALEPTPNHRPERRGQLIGVCSMDSNDLDFAQYIY